MVRQIFTEQASGNGFEIDISGDEPSDPGHRPDITRTPRPALQEYEWTTPEALRRWEQERQRGRVPPPGISDYQPPKAEGPNPFSKIH